MKTFMYICEIAASLSECMISFYFLIRFFGYNKSKGLSHTIIWFIFLFIDSALISEIENFELLTLVIFVIILFLFALFSLKGNKIEKLLYCVLLCIIISLINLLVMNVMAGMMQYGEVKLLHSGTAHYELRILILFVSKFIYFLAVKAILMIKLKDNYILSFKEWLFILVFFAFSCFICISLWYINRSHENFNASLYIVIIISLIVINIMLYWILQKLGKENYKKTKIALLELKLNSQKELITEIKTQYDEIKTLKHDMKHYINYPLHLLENGKALDAKKYLNDLYNNKIEPIIPVVFTNSEMVDAVINSKISLCRKQGIEIKCEVISDCLYELELDLSIMLANLLDNAIENSRLLDIERKILLSIKHEKSYLNINIRNIINTSVLSCNPELKTKKADKKLHGYGLKSIKKIVDYYDGSIEISEGERYFIVDILLKIN